MKRVERRCGHLRTRTLRAAGAAALVSVSTGAMAADTLIVKDTEVTIVDDRSIRGTLPGFLVEGTGVLTVGQGGIVGNPDSYNEVSGSQAMLDVQGEGTIVGKSLFMRDGAMTAGMSGEGTARIQVEKLEALGNSVISLGRAHVGLGIDQNLSIKLDGNSSLTASPETYIDGGIGVVGNARMILHGATVETWTAPAIDIRGTGADGVRIDQGAVVRGGIQGVRIYRGLMRIENSQVVGGYLGHIGNGQTRTAGLVMFGTSSDAHVIVDKGALIQGIGGDAVGAHIQNDGSGTQWLEIRGNSLVNGELHAIYAEPRDIASGTEASRIDVVGAVLEARAGDAVLVKDTSLRLTLDDGAGLIGHDGQLVRTEGKGVIDMAVRNTHLEGDIGNGPQGTISVTLGTSASLRGGVSNVSLMRVEAGGAFFMEKDSDIARLEMGGGTVSLSRAPEATHVLRLDELSGQGTFLMHEDFQKNTGDLLQVSGRAEGSHVLQVAATGNEPGGTGFAVVKTGSGEARFALAGDGTVDVGTYRYRLVRQGNDWVLAPVSDSGDPGGDPDDNPDGKPDDNPDGKPDDTPSGTTDDPAASGNGTADTDHGAGQDPAPHPRLSGSANTVLGLASATPIVARAQAAVVGSRLDQLRSDPRDGNAAWAKPYSRRYNVTPVQGASYVLEQQGVTMGADTRVGKRHGDLYAGVAFGASTSKSKFEQVRGAKAQFDGLSAVLYGMWNDENGWYADATAGLHRFSVDATTRMSDGRRAHGRYRQLAVTTSLETGKTLSLGENAFAEPYGKAMLFRGQGVNYSLDNGMAVRQAPQTTVQEEVGVRVGTTLTLGGHRDAEVRPYVKLAGASLQGYGRRTDINGRRFDTGLRNGASGIVGLGVMARAGERLYLVAEAERARGSGLRQPLGVDLGVRYVW